MRRFVKVVGRWDRCDSCALVSTFELDSECSWWIFVILASIRIPAIFSQLLHKMAAKASFITLIRELLEDHWWLNASIAQYTGSSWFHPLPDRIGVGTTNGQVPSAQTFIAPPIKNRSSLPVSYEYDAKSNYDSVDLSLLLLVPGLFRTISILMSYSWAAQFAWREDLWEPGGVSHRLRSRSLLTKHYDTSRMQTVIMFLGVRAIFSSADKTALWDCLVRSGVPKMHLSIPKDLHSQVGLVHVVSFRCSFSSQPNSYKVSLYPVLYNCWYSARCLTGVTSVGFELILWYRVLELGYTDGTNTWVRFQWYVQIRLVSYTLYLRRIFGKLSGPCGCTHP